MIKFYQEDAWPALADIIQKATHGAWRNHSANSPNGRYTPS